MRFVIQRVQHASVTVDGETCGAINKGFMVLIGVSEEDNEAIHAAKVVFRKPIISVNIRGIAEDGGGLNCISWEM